ncbi:hypothetical protein ES703_103069 [subsurface metagenome]
MKKLASWCWWRGGGVGKAAASKFFITGGPGKKIAAGPQVRQAHREPGPAMTLTTTGPGHCKTAARSLV